MICAARCAPASAVCLFRIMSPSLCIAHAQPGLHKVYDQHSYREEKRRAFELWAARVKEIVEPGARGNVVSIAGRG